MAKWKRSSRSLNAMVGIFSRSTHPRVAERETREGHRARLCNLGPEGIAQLKVILKSIHRKTCNPIDQHRELKRSLIRFIERSIPMSMNGRRRASSGA